MPNHPDDVTVKFPQVAANVISIRSNPELDAIQPLTFEEIMNSNPAPLEFILKPWLPAQGIAFIYAATGVGKTLFTLNIAYAIATGCNFLKYTVSKPRKVLYVDGEMAFVQVFNRLVDIVKQQGYPDTSNLINFKLLTPDKCHIKIPRICTPEGQDFFNKMIEALGIEVLILDNLSTLSAIDENNSKEWKVVQDWLLDLRSKGVSIIVVHHAGKDKTGYRGTSRMLDCANTAISLQELPQTVLEREIIHSNTFKVEYPKHRDFGGQEAMPFEVNLNKNGWSFISLEKTNTMRIVEMFSELGMKPVSIAMELGVSDSYVRRIVRKYCRK